MIWFAGWRIKAAAGVVTTALLLTGCGGDDPIETETEVEIPGIEEPEIEVEP